MIIVLHRSFIHFLGSLFEGLVAVYHIALGLLCLGVVGTPRQVLRLLLHIRTVVGLSVFVLGKCDNVRTVVILLFFVVGGCRRRDVVLVSVDVGFVQIGRAFELEVLF